MGARVVNGGWRRLRELSWRRVCAEEPRPPGACRLLQLYRAPPLPRCRRTPLPISSRAPSTSSRSSTPLPASCASRDAPVRCRGGGSAAKVGAAVHEGALRRAFGLGGCAVGTAACPESALQAVHRGGARVHLGWEQWGECCPGLQAALRNRRCGRCRQGAACYELPAICFPSSPSDPSPLQPAASPWGPSSTCAPTSSTPPFWGWVGGCGSGATSPRLVGYHSASWLAADRQPTGSRRGAGRRGGAGRLAERGECKGVLTRRLALFLQVPFVDCLTTMLDESIPLTGGWWVGGWVGGWQAGQGRAGQEAEGQPDGRVGGWQGRAGQGMNPKGREEGEAFDSRAPLRFTPPPPPSSQRSRCSPAPRPLTPGPRPRILLRCSDRVGGVGQPRTEGVLRIHEGGWGSSALGPAFWILYSAHSASRLCAAALLDCAQLHAASLALPFPLHPYS